MDSVGYTKVSMEKTTANAIHNSICGLKYKAKLPITNYVNVNPDGSDFKLS